MTDKYRGSQVGEKCLIPILIGLSASLIFSCDEQLYKSCFPSVCVSVRYVLWDIFQKINLEYFVFQALPLKILDNLFVGHFLRK